MHRTDVPSTYMTGGCFGIPRALRCLILAAWCSAAVLAQTASQTANPAARFSTPATHILGFEGAPSNASGTLSIQDNALLFQKSGKPPAQLKAAAVQSIVLGEESKQLGGTPMTLGKAAAPFGGGRAVSLFAHKKYDILTLEYCDSEGGLHGAIFQVNKGRGEAVRSQLIANGAHVSQGEEVRSAQSSAEVPVENK